MATKYVKQGTARNPSLTKKGPGRYRPFQPAPPAAFCVMAPPHDEARAITVQRPLRRYRAHLAELARQYS